MFWILDGFICFISIRSTSIIIIVVIGISLALH